MARSGTVTFSQPGFVGMPSPMAGTAFVGNALDNRLVVDAGDQPWGVAAFHAQGGHDVLEFSAVNRIVMSLDRALGLNREATRIDMNDAAGLQTIGRFDAVDVERFVIRAGAFDDVLRGSAGDDWLDGGAGTDVFTGSAGDDGYVFDHYDDRVIGNDGGIDTIWSTASVDLRRSEGVENLRLKLDDTEGTGNALANTITGSTGRNVIAGGAGNDKLSGKGGADTFAFAEMGKAHRDAILDFGADDTIRLDASVFGGLRTDPDRDILDVADFVLGSKATEAHAQILYSRSTGILSYDADGIGAGAAEEIAFIGKALGFMDNAHIVLA